MTLALTRLLGPWHHARMPPLPADLPPAQLRRRHLLASGSALGLLALVPLESGAQAGAKKDALDFTRLLRQGSCAVLIRHADTEPGTGDPPGFRLGDCNTQRLLSLEGRDQSRRLGQWFKARRLSPREVLSSQWCRCKHTAELAFGRATEWPALNSTFRDSNLQPAQTRELRERLQDIPEGQFEVWVTHQVNMTHLTDEYPAMGEAFLVNRSGRIQMRYAFG